MTKKRIIPPMNESQRLRELVREIGLPLSRLQEIIALKSEDCLAWWSNHDHKVQVASSAFSGLAKIVGLNEDQLFKGNYDRELARKRLLGDFRSLPARYQENQNSFLRTSAHIIRYVVLTRGQAFADQILYNMNVSPLIYQDLNAQINLTYFADLLDVLVKKGFSQEELDTLASVIFLSLQETKLGQCFQAAESPFDVYTTLAKNFDYFDSNFEYKSHFAGKSYILKTVLPLDQHASLKGSPQKIMQLMRYRRILAAWFPFLAGMAPLFPKAKLLKFSSDIVEVQYEFDLSPNSMRPTKLLVV